MTNSPVCIYQAADAGEAQLVKGFLLEAGIEAHVVGENQPYAGLLAATSVDILVSQADQARAVEIIAQYEAEQSAHTDRADWFCQRCRAAVPGAFDLCFKCGADQEGNLPAEEDESEVASTATLLTASPADDPSESALPGEPLSPEAKRDIWIEIGVVLSIVVTFYYGAIAFVVWPEMAAGSLVSIYASISYLVRDLQVICMVLFVMWRSEKQWSDFGLVRPQFFDVPMAGCVFLVHFFLWMAVARIWMSLDLPTDSAIDTREASTLDQVLVVVAFYVGAFMEELMLRGYLLTRFEQLFKSPIAAILLSTVIFAGYHMYQGVLGVVAAGLCGLVYGAAFCLLRRLWPLVAAHTVFNLYSYYGI
jgi:membrane protease YdiL (CAAX protease family)